MVENFKEDLARRYIAAFTAGEQAAAAISIGDYLGGALLAAKQAGYANMGSERKMFIEGYIGAFEKRFGKTGIKIDGAGIVQSL
jgi:hypothetical protein